MWRKGMKVACIRRKPWENDPIGPAYGEVVTLDRKFDERHWFLVEYPMASTGQSMVFNRKWFRPLMNPKRSLAKDRTLFRKIADSAPKEIIPQVDA